jgi:hypothetical protein
VPHHEVIEKDTLIILDVYFYENYILDKIEFVYRVDGVVKRGLAHSGEMGFSLSEIVELFPQTMIRLELSENLTFLSTNNQFTLKKGKEYLFLMLGQTDDFYIIHFFNESFMASFFTKHKSGAIRKEVFNRQILENCPACVEKNGDIYRLDDSRLEDGKFR